MRSRILVPCLLLIACGPLVEPEEQGHALGVEEQGLMVCPTTVVEGVDVFDGQGNPAWHTVKGAGREFVFTKATQGATFNASTFRANWHNLRDAGIARSPYHFFDATIDGVEQATHFLNIVADAGGLLPDDLPAMLDLECPSATTQAASSQTCEGSSSGWAPPATVRQRALDWLHTVEAATGKPPILYSYVSWFGTQGFTDPSLTHYPLYIASLSATCATVPAPWTTPTFWQYSFTGTVAGISGEVDLDRFLGNESDLLAFAQQYDGGKVNTPDAGSRDAGTADAGARDAGTPPADSGTPMDDAGMPPMDDAGMTADDAGMSQGDAGQGPETPGHCGCDSAPGGAAFAVLLLTAALRPRRS